MVYTQSFRRKLVKQGPSTLTVSLPAEWVKANNLDAGQEIDLSLKENDLIITIDTQQQSEQTLDVNVKGMSERMMGLLLNALHKKGLSELRIACEASQLQYIQDRVSRHLLGYEIVEQTKERVVVRFVMKTDPDELPQLTRRAFLVTLTMADGLANNPGQAKELAVLEETNNRLTNYCERMLSVYRAYERNTVFEYILIWLLEKVADEYRDIIKEERHKSPGATETARLLRQFYELYYTYSFEAHDSFVQELNEAKETLKQLNSPYLAILNLLDQTGGSLIAMNV